MSSQAKGDTRGGRRGSGGVFICILHFDVGGAIDRRGTLDSRDRCESPLKGT